MRQTVRELIETGEARFKSLVAELLGLGEKLAPARREELCRKLDEMLGKIREDGELAKEDTAVIKR